MSRRLSWINIVGFIFGAVAIAATVYAFVGLFGPKGSGRWFPRSAEAFQQLSEGVTRGIRRAQPWNPGAVGWRSAEGEESVSGAQKVLSVNNVSGPIRVTGWDQDTVRVHYVKQARTEVDLKDFVIQIRGDGDTVTVQPIYEASGLLGRFGSVDLEISVPKRIARIAAHNVSGEIVIQDLQGTVEKELSTVSGSITTAGTGNLTLRSTSGAVQFDFSGDALKAGTVSGAIRGSVARLGSGGADLGTVSGSIDVRAYSALDAAVDLRSVSGSIRCDLPVSIREQTRGKLAGTIGKGGATFSAHTTSGSIRIGKD